MADPSVEGSFFCVSLQQQKAGRGNRILRIQWTVFLTDCEGCNSILKFCIPH